MGIFLTAACWEDRPGLLDTGYLRRNGLSSALLDDLLRDVRRHLLVPLELHRVVGPALRVGAQVGGIPEHLAQGNLGVNRKRVAALLGALQVPATTREIAHHVAHEVLWSYDLDREHGLQEHRLGAPGSLLERDRAGDLEGDLRGVHVVILAVHQRDAYVDHWITGLDAVLQGLLDALLNSRDVFRWDGSTLDLVDEVKALAGRGLHVDVDDPDLARAAGLAHELAFDLLDRAADRLAVGDLRAPDVRLDAELALHAVDEHFEVQLTHARNLGLAGFFVGAHLEGGVLLGEAAERDRHLLLVDLRLWLDGDLDNRLRESDVLKLDGCVRSGQRVAGYDLLDADRCRDVAGVDLGDLLALVGVHHQNAPDALCATAVDVEHARAGLEFPGVDAEVGELADVRVGHDLEGERGKGLGVVGVALDLRFLAIALDRFGANDRRHVKRRGQVVDDGVEQWLHALVLERGAAQNRSQLGREGGLADRLLKNVLRHLGLLEDQLEQSVVVVRDLLQQVLTSGLSGFEQRLRDLGFFLLSAELVFVDDCLHLDEIDDTYKIALSADRQLDRDGVRAEPVDHRLHALLEVSAGAVHLVDVGDT